jgi:hypothetical protein
MCAGEKHKHHRQLCGEFGVGERKQHFGNNKVPMKKNGLGFLFLTKMVLLQ